MSKARGLADLGNVYSDGALSNRNMVTNGAMQLAQRGVLFTGVNSTNMTCDRFKCLIATGTMGAYTISQDADAPSGFANSLKFENTIANASPLAGAFNVLFYAFEGQDLQRIGKGTADAQQVTLSFWVKSNKTGTYQVNLNEDAYGNQRMVGDTYAVSVSGTWEKKTITFPADTVGAFADDNLAAAQIEWWFGSGSTYSSGATPTAWETMNNADRNAGSNVNLADTVGNYFQITGVQLEVGDTATPFEQRSYAQEMALCERYFEIQDTGDQTFPLVRPSPAGTGAPSGGIVYRTVKRADPSITFSGPASGGGALLPADLVKGSGNTSGTTINSPTSIVAGASTYLRYKATIDAEL